MQARFYAPLGREIKGPRKGKDPKKRGIRSKEETRRKEGFPPHTHAAHLSGCFTAHAQDDTSISLLFYCSVCGFTGDPSKEDTNVVSTHPLRFSHFSNERVCTIHYREKITTNKIRSSIFRIHYHNTTVVGISNITQSMFLLRLWTK